MTEPSLALDRNLNGIRCLSRRNGSSRSTSGQHSGKSVEPSGSLCGSVLFNLDEFDDATVAGWAADLLRILTSAVSEPDRDWKLL